jgi:hypothetical protein
VLVGGIGTDSRDVSIVDRYHIPSRTYKTMTNMSYSRSCHVLIPMGDQYLFAIGGGQQKQRLVER